MNSHDFKCSITAGVTATEAAGAICRVSDWWAKNFEGQSQKAGDNFTVRFGETWVAFNVTELTPNKICWMVTDCYLPWLKNKIEWTGTQPIFEIATENNLTTINFTHEGLTPQVECYGRCVNGWTEHITQSLLQLLTTGKGEPA